MALLLKGLPPILWAKFSTDGLLAFFTFEFLILALRQNFVTFDMDMTPITKD